MVFDIGVACGVWRVEAEQGRERSCERVRERANSRPVIFTPADTVTATKFKLRPAVLKPQVTLDFGQKRPVIPLFSAKSLRIVPKKRQNQD